MTTELSLAYWEDRGAQLAQEHLRQRSVPVEPHDVLAIVTADELSQLTTQQRGNALEALLRGYRFGLADPTWRHR